MKLYKNSKALFQVLKDFKLPTEKKEKVVNRRLKHVLISAYHHVPYYREIMDEIGYNPVKDYSGPQDLKQFPITTKADYKKYDLSCFLKKGSNTDSLFTDSTSGSTGIPLKIYRDPYERSVQIAKWLRVLFLNGYSIKDKVMSLTSPARLNEGKSLLQCFGFLRRRPVNYLLPMSQIVDIFLEYKPQVLYGNRSHVDLMSQEMLRRGIKPNRLKMLVVGAEIIREHHRDLYKQAFGLDAIESYGSVELGVMAFETPEKSGLQLCDDLTLFEFLTEDGSPALPGEPGKIVVTDLLGKTMPFIRYDQGDLAYTKKIVKKDGSKYKAIEKIIGRDDDYIVLSNGSMLPLVNFDKVMYKDPKIKQYNVIQKQRRSLKSRLPQNRTILKEFVSAC